MTLKKVLKTKVGMHIYSFAKTYVTMALGIYLVLHKIQGELDPMLLVEINLTDMVIVMTSLKGGFVAVLRNIYKLLTE
ncbi:hypothetical protein KAR28_04350 [Candidatus Parcubacteria bacterium]|nr:hypothetical protein [Candidatus Parcubacteria bacterium]